MSLLSITYFNDLRDRSQFPCSRLLTLLPSYQSCGYMRYLTVPAHIEGRPSRYTSYSCSVQQARRSPAAPSSSAAYEHSVSCRQDDRLSVPGCCSDIPRPSIPLQVHHPAVTLSPTSAYSVGTLVDSDIWRSVDHLSALSRTQQCSHICCPSRTWQCCAHGGQ